MTIVIYVEKKAVATSIAKTLGAGKFIVVENLTKQGLGVLGYWSFIWNDNQTYIIYGVGHLAGLCDAKDYDNKYAKWDTDVFPCFPVKAKTKPINSPKHFALAKKKFLKADLIISATDPDREGEVVFDNIYNTIGCQAPWKRVWLPSDLTPPKISAAFNSLEAPETHYSLRLAGKTRAFVDWIVGINLTVAASNQFGGVVGSKYIPMNVGRVQTTVLNMVVQRTRSIESFKPEPFWSVYATCKKGEHCFVATLANPKKFSNIEEAKMVMGGCLSKNGIVSKVKKTKRTIRKPLLYSTTNLQIAVNSKYGYDVNTIAEVMESLYNKHYISYPRTELCVVTTALMPECKSIIKKLFNTTEYSYLSSDEKYWCDFTNRHFNDKPFINSSDAHTAIIPTLVIPDFGTLTEEEKNIYDLIAKSLLRLPKQDVVIEDTSVSINIDGYEFRASGSVELNHDVSWYVVDGAKLNSELPIIKEYDILDCEVAIKEGKTKPESYFTEGSLLKSMKYANKIISDEELADFMVEQNCGLGTGGTRPGIITSLKKHKMLRTDKSHIVPTDKGYWLIDHIPTECRMITDAETTAKWEQMLYRIATSEKNTAIALTNKFVSSIKTATEQYYKIIMNQPKDLFSNNKSSENNVSELKCPLCGKELRKQKWGYGCSGYKDGCKFTIGSYRNKKLTEKQIRDLLTKGVTNKITFKSKSGEDYQGYLSFDNDKRINFTFANSKKKGSK